MDNTQVITFDRPFTYEDKEYTELKLDLESLTGKDLLDASHEVRAIGETSAIVEMSKSYYAVVAAKAAKVPVDMLLALPAREFAKLTIAVQYFLLD